MIDFKVKRSEDCILIDTKKWVQNSSNILSIHKMSGRTFPTYLANVLSVNPVKEEYKGLVNEGDLVLISRVASEIASYKAFAVEAGDNRFYNVPISQICGKFSSNDLSYESLEVLTDKVLVEKVEPEYEKSLIVSTNDNTMLGKVLKAGPKSLYKEDEVILIRDNVTTMVTLKGKPYYVVDNDMIVGHFSAKDNISLETLNVNNKSVILKQYIPEKALNSSLLTPILNYEDSDYSEIYNRDLFKVVAVDKELTKISIGDILLLNTDVTNYVFLKGEKYNIVSGMDHIEAKIEE